MNKKKILCAVRALDNDFNLTAPLLIPFVFWAVYLLIWFSPVEASSCDRGGDCHPGKPGLDFSTPALSARVFLKKGKLFPVS